jgi:hypothetical protein
MPIPPPSTPPSHLRMLEFIEGSNAAFLSFVAVIPLHRIHHNIELSKQITYAGAFR